MYWEIYGGLNNNLPYMGPSQEDFLPNKIAIPSAKIV